MNPRLVGALALLGWAGGAACAGTPPPPRDDVARAGLEPATTSDLKEATATLAALRATAPRVSYARAVRARVSLGPHGTFDAQGGLAVRPGDAVRLVLVGPMGATALDLWAKGRRYRLALPAAERVVAGSLDDPGDDGAARTPVRALVSALLDPLAGRLRFVGKRPSGALVLGVLGASGMALVERTASRLLLTWPARGDALELSPPTLAAPAGGRAHFVAPRDRVEVDVTVTSVVDAPPDDDAFVEPADDAPAHRAEGGGR